MDLPFRSQASSAASAPGPIGALEPYSDTTQGQAPGGLWPSEAELPVRAQLPRSGGGTTGGDTLPAPGTDEGAGLPPAGG
jgi:hypothetical protein